MKRLALFTTATLLALPAMAQDRTPYEQSVIAQRGWDIHGCDTDKFVFVYIDPTGPSNRENLAYISSGCPIIAGLGDDEQPQQSSDPEPDKGDNGGDDNGSGGDNGDNGDNGNGNGGNGNGAGNGNGNENGNASANNGKGGNGKGDKGKGNGKGRR